MYSSLTVASAAFMSIIVGDLATFPAMFVLFTSLLFAYSVYQGVSMPYPR